ncbi:MAG: hypothetical protein K2X35_24740 [Bryobacteraceae bacterium]|nr:hypothetical protein [Bryobacteraceae bacterium]
MIPSFEIHFDARGEMRGKAAVPAGAGNLLVLCHGWNNTAEEARELYQGLLRLLEGQQMPEGTAAALVFWPSKQFAEPGPEVMSRLRPEMFDAEDGAAVLARLREAEWYELLAPPFPGVREDRAEGAAGLAGIMRRMGNLASYYVMKDRAGVVGRRGLASWLGGLPGEVRVHLVGHSFGARLITAAAQAAGADSLTLLQAAFSQFAFAEKFDGVHDGAFRDVVARRKVRGPIAITHSRHDRAVGLAYAVASRIAGQNASAIGGKQDEFGGLGRNGARRTPEAKDTEETRCDLAAAPVTNFSWDHLIRGHSDILHEEVGALIRAVM